MKKLPSFAQSICCAVLWSFVGAVGLCGLTGPVYADIKLRPGEKIKERPKDFRKETEKFGYPTPEPKNVSVSFVTGGTVGVSLEASTRYMGTLKFEIREQPKYGNLSAVRTHADGELNHVSVTYTHTGGDEALNDRFTYVVKIGESSASVPGVVTLVGKRAMPLLNVVEHPNFKAVKPGDTEIGRLVVQNGGTAALDSVVAWPTPFFGPPRLQLAPGQTQEYLVQAKPAVVGDYKLNLELQPGVPSSQVKGGISCLVPYVVSPGSLELIYDNASGNRKGSVRVSNAGDIAISLKVEGDPRLQVVEMLEIASKESVEVALALADDDVKAFRGELAIVQGAHREKVFVSALPEPAQPRLVSPADGKIAFGTVEKGKTGESRFIVANDGGEDLVLTIADSPPFVLGREVPLVVAGGSQVEYLLKFQSEQGGNFAKQLSINGGATKLGLNVSGTLFDPRRPMQPGKGPTVENPLLDKANPSRKPASAPAASTRPIASAPVTPAPAIEPSLPVPLTQPVPSPAAAAPPKTPTEPIATTSKLQAGYQKVAKLLPMARSAAFYASNFGFGQSDVAEFKSSTLTPVAGIGLMDAGRDHLVLSWSNPEVEPARYQIEVPVRVTGEPGTPPMKLWKPLTEWKDVTAPDGMSAARIDGLSPGLQYEFRICGVDADGKMSKPSDIITVATMPPLKMPWWAWMVLGCIVLLAGVLILQQRQGAR